MSWDKEALVLSMCGPVFNRVKLCFLHPKKNFDLARNTDIQNFVSLLGEQLLPQWCKSNIADAEKIKKMHNLMFLFAYKTQQVFMGRVIHQIIDQNWDMKGFKCTLMRIVQTLNLGSQ